MQHARVAAMRGTCSKLQVGAVGSREGRLLVSGYNGTPAGMRHCDHSCSCGLGNGGHQIWCPSVAPCEEAVHAEENCIAYSARHGISLEGAEIHTTDSPCPFCARLIINAGIVRVVYEREYRIIGGLVLLEIAGVQIEQFASPRPRVI